MKTSVYHSQMNVLRIYPSKTALTPLSGTNQHKMGIYLALGSNVGDKKANIEKAILLLSEKITDMKKAPMYVSRAVGYTKQDDFINTAVFGQTELEPKELLRFVKNIEKQIGRIHRFRWGPREIDIDIIFYGDLVYKDKELEIPHPAMHERDFVLKPLSDLDGTIVHPVMKKTVKELLITIKNASIVEKIP